MTEGQIIMAVAPQPEAELNRIQGAIIAARESLLAEEAFDISPLTGSLDSLCEQIAAMPAETAKAYAAPLQTTLQLLEALEADIRDAHAALRERMISLGGGDLADEDGDEGPA